MSSEVSIFAQQVRSVTIDVNLDTPTSGGARIFAGGGGRHPRGSRDTFLLNLLNFPENCMNSRKIWSLGGCALVTPPCQL